MNPLEVSLNIMNKIISNYPTVQGREVTNFLVIKYANLVITTSHSGIIIC
jgi:hypothetical protein